LESAVHYPADKMKQWFGNAPAEPEQPTWTAEERYVHNLSTAQEYLALHDLTEMYVDIRAYEPAEQWRRLRTNREISGFWKYTGGTLQHLEYCLFPGRVLRRDRYNVFTNTLSINSTRPERTLYAAATAKYLCERDYPGAFATGCYFPVVPLFRDYHVANDALSYARYRGDWELEQRLYPHVYGNFGSELVSQGTSLFPQFALLPFYVRPMLSLGGRMVGKSTGAYVRQHRGEEVAAENSQATETRANSF
jgi:hypothetical protein